MSRSVKGRRFGSSEAAGSQKYRKPRLTEYGDLLALTQGANPAKTNDMKGSTIGGKSK